MSEDFGFQIVGDASKANVAIGQVLTQLDRIEVEARAAGGAMSSSFASAGSAISKAAAEAKQSADAQKTLAQRMHGISTELENQERMYQRVHGPAQRYAADLKALDSLLSQNAISAGQYADQVTRLNRSIDGAPARTAAPAAPTGASVAMGGIRAAAGAAGVAIGASELVGIADGYTQIQNRLRGMTGDQQRANELFNELHGIANRTRSDLTATVDAYAGMSRATKALGLSQDDTLQVTETLNKLVTASGKSASESAAGLMQFSQALSSGRLQGDELRSVFETMPTLVDALMASTGKTQAQLREMGSEGQLTSAVMIKALQSASSAADASLGKTIPTIGQALTQVKNDITAAFGPALQSMASGLVAAGETARGVIGVLGELASVAQTADKWLNPLSWTKRAVEFVQENTVLFDSVVDGVKRAIEVEDKYAKHRGALVMAIMQGDEAFRRAHTELTAFNLKMTLGAEAAQAFRAQIIPAAAAADTLARAAGGANTALAGMNVALTGIVGALSKDGFNAIAKVMDPWFVPPETATKIKSVAKEVDEYSKMLQQIKQPQQDAAQSLNILGNLYMNNRISLEEYNRETAKHLDLMHELGLTNAKSVTSGIAPPVDYTKGIDTGAIAPAGATKLAAIDQSAIDLNERWRSQQEQMRLENQEFANSFKPVTDAVMEMFTQGKTGADAFNKAILQVWGNLMSFMLKKAFGAGGDGEMFGGGGGGLLAGGLTGGVGMLMGMAHGGVIHQGTGGTDSQIMAIRKSPNEHVTTMVETPTQYSARMAGGNDGGGGGGVSFGVHVRNDEREITSAFRGSAGKQVTADINREWRNRNR